MRSAHDKIFEYEQAIEVMLTLKKRGNTLVTTNGCFDILHRGHVTYLNQARLLGNKLFVGINSDLSVKKLKGAKRPLQNQEDRRYIIASLESVDGAFIFNDETPVPFLQRAKPHIHVKGGDYDVKSYGKDIPEREIVEKNGGKIVLIPLVEGCSSSKIIGALK